MKVLSAYKTPYGPLFVAQDERGRILFWRDDRCHGRYWAVREGYAAFFKDRTIALRQGFRPLLRAATGPYVVRSAHACGQLMQNCAITPDDTIKAEFAPDQAAQALIECDEGTGYSDLNHLPDWAQRLADCFEPDDAALV